jgi:N-methylhydantoinase A
MSRYIAQLESELPRKVGLRIMKSDGGVIGAGHVRKQAIQTALSGPAAGVIGAYHVASLAGFQNIITLDMGGTSTDVSICPGEPVRRHQSEIDGLPLRIRMLDIETIGAGGGSIARLDAGGVLHVGPESAGAVPGPVVYGRGGTQPTVSDANAILGRLDADHFLGGEMTLDLDSALQAIQQLANQMNIDPDAAARGIIDVANVNIDRALRRVTVARGYDPRDFTLMTFGGAGGLHACELAEQLEIPRVLVPRHPGVLCALGLLLADVVRDYSLSVLSSVTDVLSVELTELLEGIFVQARDDLVAEGIPRENRTLAASLDLRYQGQAYEINLPFEARKNMAQAFHDAHKETYGHSMPERVVEVVNLRVQAVGIVDHPQLASEPVDENASLDEAYIGEKPSADGDLKLYDREKLRPGVTLEGPSLVFQLDCTTYIAEGWTAHVDGYHNLILEQS